VHFADHGLALSSRFQLSREERDFFFDGHQPLTAVMVKWRRQPTGTPASK